MLTRRHFHKRHRRRTSEGRPGNPRRFWWSWVCPDQVRAYRGGYRRYINAIGVRPGGDWRPVRRSHSILNLLGAVGHSVPGSADILPNAGGRVASTQHRHRAGEHQHRQNGCGNACVNTNKVAHFDLLFHAGPVTAGHRFSPRTGNQPPMVRHSSPGVRRSLPSISRERHFCFTSRGPALAWARERPSSNAGERRGTSITRSVFGGIKNPPNGVPIDFTVE
jgi:hypothetical protein